MICHFERNILHINIVLQFLERLFVFWLELNSYGIFLISAGFASIVSCVRVWEANETIPSWWVIGVEWNLQTFDVSEFLIFVLQIDVLHVFWNVLDENIVWSKLFFISSKKLFIKLKSTALFTVNFEVSHSFACLFELNWVLNVDNGRVEWSCKISSNLWLDIKVHVSLRLESFSNFLAANVLFWKIVKIDQILVLVAEWLMHFIWGVFYDKSVLFLILLWRIEIIMITWLMLTYLKEIILLMLWFILLTGK